MSLAITQLAAGVAAALDDPQFAAAVDALRPALQPPRPSTLNAEGVAELLHLPVTTVRQYARDGRIPAYKAGRHWIFFSHDLEAALRSNALAA